LIAEGLISCYKKNSILTIKGLLLDNKTIAIIDQKGIYFTSKDEF